MKKVILIPTHNAKGNGGGIRVYNEALESLFKDDDELCVKLFKTLPKSSPLGNYYSSEDISLYLEKEQPDIIHINGYTSLIPIQLVKYAHKHNIKIVFTPHWHPFETMTYPFLKKTYFNLFISPILKKIDHIFTINNEEYDFFKTKNRNVSLISHWIYDQSDINSSTFSKQPNMILFVGNPLYKNKGFDHLLALRNKGYELNVVCRTRHDVPNDIIQHINVSDKEVKKLYQRAALVVIPSKYEAFSYTALEALQNGTPVVMSDRVRIADFLNNIKGYNIFNYGNLDDFIAKVNSTIGTGVDTDTINQIFSASVAKQKYKQKYISIL